MSKARFGESLWSHRGWSAAFVLTLAVLLPVQPTLAQTPYRFDYRSPSDVAYSPDGSTLAVADRTWAGVVLIKSSDGTVTREIRTPGDPTHVLWRDAGTVLVAEGRNGTVAEIDVSAGTVSRRFTIGVDARGLAITPDGAHLLACDRFANKLVVVKLGSGEIESTMEVGREPSTVAVSKDGKLAVVGNKLPRAADPVKGSPAAEVSIVDLGNGQVTALALPKFATMVRQVVLSPDGRWAYVTHEQPRGSYPVTQLDDGWVMTNALSVIDLSKRSQIAVYALDRTGAGAAHPWGAVLRADGNKLWVTLEGVREMATVDLKEILFAPAPIDTLRDPNELQAAGIIKRTSLGDIDGPRGVALSPDGKTLAVAAYFSGQVLLLASDDLSVKKTITLPNNPAEDARRKGERYFHSATNCYQGWLSCSSCHDEGHADGLNWDLQNDGTGNPKQTKSLVLASKTPPSMVTGARENAEIATRVGYQFIEFQSAPEERVQATYAFVESLEPEPSPFLGSDGQLTPEAVEGQKLFEGQAGCSGCHAGPYFTDMQKHDVGTAPRPEDGPLSTIVWEAKGYDTPTLIETWRTAPYLHLGTALTIQDAISAHVKAPVFSPQERDQLAAYVKQIGPTRHSDLPVEDAGARGGDAPASPLDTAGAGGHTSASGGGTGGSTDSTSSGSAGPSSTGTTPTEARGDASAQGSAKLSHRGCSCRLASDHHGGALVLLFGLALLVGRARKQTDDHR